MSRILKGHQENLKKLVKELPKKPNVSDVVQRSFQAYRSPDRITIGEAKEMVAKEVEIARQEAFAEAEQRLKAPINQALENLEGVLDEISHFRRELFHEAEGEIVELVKKLCEMILGQELRHNEELLGEVVQKALKVVEKEKQIKMLVNPDDLRFFRTAKEDFLKKFNSATDIEVEADPSIPSSGALLQTKTRQVDMTIEQMVGHLIERSKDKMNEVKETGDEGDKV